MTRLFAGTPFDRPPTCDRCGQQDANCECPPPLLPPDQQTARLRVEKRQKGKVVTVVDGLPARGNDLPDLLSQLKATCGAGGTLKDSTLELQGDHLARVTSFLEEMGYQVKR